MKSLKLLIVVLTGFALIISCKPGEKKEMTPEAFLTIENEILTTDLSVAAKENVIEKSGFTLKEYTEYEQRVESDPSFKAKIGEVRLKMEQDKINK